MSTIANVQVGIQNAAGTLAHSYTVLTFSNGSTQTLAAGPNSSNQLTLQTYSTPNYNQAPQQAGFHINRLSELAGLDYPCLASPLEAIFQEQRAFKFRV